MKRLLSLLIVVCILFSCKEKKYNSVLYNVRSDIRFGSTFFSIFISENGTAYVIKGHGSRDSDTFKILSSDTSNIFKLDSANVFFERLNQIKDKPGIGASNLDAARVEIFYNQKKVYDDFRWNETFWYLFRPIMEQIPSGWNPFRTSENPFG